MPPINEKSDSSFDASVTYNLSILREATMNYSHNIDDLAYPTLPATIINIPKQITTKIYIPYTKSYNTTFAMPFACRKPLIGLMKKNIATSLKRVGRPVTFT